MNHLEEGAAAPREIENYTPTDVSGLNRYEGYNDVGFKESDFLEPPFLYPSYSEPQEPPSLEYKW